MLFLCLASGCIFVVEDTTHRHNVNAGSYDHYYEYLPWFEHAGADCSYDVHLEKSIWKFNALVDSYYGYEDIYLVQINVHGVNDHTENTYNLWEDAYGHWSLDLESQNVYCGHSYDIEFVAYDSFGDWASVWVQW